MATENDNCMICSEEFGFEDLKSVALSTINVTKFKICKNCLKQTDPKDDYIEVRNIVNAYLNFELFIKE